MRVIVVGCGRVGAGLAESLARAGNEVTILDVTSEAFNRLESDFPGSAVRGDGTDEDVLRRAGAEGADALFALTEGDNRNILTAQLAAETLGIAQVVAKINDPVRAQAYRDLGLATICRTTMLVDALAQFLGMPGDPGETGVSTATGQHPGGEHHDTAATGPAPRPATEPAATEPAATESATEPAATAGDPAGVETATNKEPRAAPNAGRTGDGRCRRPWKLLRRNDERRGED